MLPEETIRSGASDKCPDCGTKLELKVCHSVRTQIIANNEWK